MAKNIKEVDEISTTDKLKAFKTLKEAGFRVEMSGSGVPTVICANLADMDKQLKSMKKTLKEIRYTGSFGIRGHRKTDNILAEDAMEAVREDSEDNNDNLETLTA